MYAHEPRRLRAHVPPLQWSARCTSGSVAAAVSFPSNANTYAAKRISTCMLHWKLIQIRIRRACKTPHRSLLTIEELRLMKTGVPFADKRQPTK